MNLSPLGALHHVGFVVESIDKVLDSFMRSLGADVASPICYDPLQKTRVVFLNTSPAEYSQIELVEPTGADSPVHRFLEQSRGGLHHLCYEVADLEAAMADFKQRKCTIVSRAKPAVAFGGRRVAWLMTPEWLLVELLEKELPAATDA